ncbi:MAG: VCBS repeat-containing protein, partial [Bryobacterales bacterium]|nr:VCBS repeat-containing protein [Bryobacterales bacterium]
MRRFVLSISSIAAAVTLAVGAYAQQPTTPNRGTGKFAPGKALAAAGVRGVTAADLDGDGVAEIVTVGLQGLAVHRREAGNDGGYRATVRLARPDLRAVAAADFDGDGKVDLAVASEAGIELLRGASGSAPGAVIQMSAAQLAAQDLNGDGLADLIAVSEDGGPVTILAGSATAGLRVADEIRGATPAAGYVAADFDRDGIADLALARRGEPAIHLYRGSAELRFSDAGTVAVDGAVTALDVHHDSAGAVGPDLVIRTAGREDVRLLPGNGDLTFREAVAAGLLVLEIAPPLALDLDSNGAVDRVVRAGSAVTVLPQAGASHGISKTHTGTFTRGGTGEYKIVVNGPAPGLTFEVSDTLPAGVTLIEDLGFGFPWECMVDGAEIRCFGSHLQPDVNGDFAPILLPVAIAANAPAVISNTATVTDATGTASATDTVTLGGGAAAPDLTIGKTHTGNFPAGGTGVFTLLVTNVGSAATTAPTVVNDTPQAGLGVASMGGTGWVCDVPARRCTNNATLGPGASFPPITVAVTVSANAPDPAQNNATVSGGGDTNAANNNAVDTVTVTRPDLRMGKQHAGNFRAGQTGAVYSLTVTNVGNGASTAAEVAVVDTLPAPLAAQSMAGAGWSCTLATLRCTRSEVLAPGAAYPPITLTVDVPANAPTLLTNRADLSGGGDTNAANNQALDPTTIEKADLTISKTHAGNFAPGARASYTITVTNVGAAASAGTVTVLENVPAALTGPAISGAGWTCVTTPQVSCSRADALAAGASYPPIVFEATVAPTAAASFTNTVTVSGGGDANGGNNTAIDNTSSGVADLTIAKTHVGNFYLGQNNATWTITVSNAGNGDTAGEVRVNEFPQSGGLGVPAMFLVNSISGSGWTCVGGAAPACTRTDVLAAGASYPPITVQGLIPGNATGTQVGNRATVEGG